MPARNKNKENFIRIVKSLSMASTIFLSGVWLYFIYWFLLPRPFGVESWEGMLLVLIIIGLTILDIISIAITLFFFRLKKESQSKDKLIIILGLIAIAIFVLIACVLSALFLHF